MDQFIKLDQFLKLADIVQSGGEAKHLIQSGQVLVNGKVETRRGRKLRQGDIVTVDGEDLVVDTEVEEEEEEERESRARRRDRREQDQRYD